MKIDELVNIAAGVLKDGNNKDFKDVSREIPSEFKSYISSFGPSIIQAGLLPTIMFYMNSSGSGGENKKEILNMIYAILRKTPKYKDAKENSLESMAISMMRSAKGKSGYLELTDDVLDSYAALKLSMRAYKFAKPAGNSK